MRGRTDYNLSHKDTLYRIVTWYLYALGLFLLGKYYQYLHTCEEAFKRCVDFSRTIKLRNKTQTKLKLINYHIKETSMLQRIVQNTEVKNLEAKLSEQGEKLTLLEKEHKEMILKLNTEIDDLRHQLNISTTQHDQQLLTLHTKHSEEIASLHTQISELKSRKENRKQLFDDILLDAAQEGDIIKITGARTLGANIYAKNEVGFTALHLAIFNDHKDVAKYLLADAPSLFITADNNHHTPMQYAAKNGDFEKLAWFYKKGKAIKEFYNDPNEFNKVYAVATADAKQYLANNKLLDSAKNNDLNGVVDALQKNAEINTKRSDGDTALHIATFFRHYDIVKLLIDHGADPTITNYQETPLDTAINWTDDRLLSMLATPFLIFSAMHGNAENNGNIKNMSMALNSGAKLTGKDIHGQIALHKAIINNQRIILKFLLLMHAGFKQDINIKDNDDLTPYQLAKKINHKILTQNAKPNDLEFYMAAKHGAYEEKCKQGKFESFAASKFGFIANMSVPNSEVKLTTTHSAPPLKPLKM